MVSRLELNDGNKIPVMAFGTGSVIKGHDVTAYVKQAIETGFDHIDTAAYYGNEDGVGKGLRESRLDRNDMFVTTKYADGDIQASIRTSLSNLGFSYVDLYLVHFPGSFPSGISVESAWREFEKIKEDGLAKSIGVSNYTVKDLQELIRIARTKPAVNQIQFHPYNYAKQKSIVEYATKHGIVIEGYSPLTPITKTPGGPVDPVIARVAKRIGGNPGQVLLKWVRSKGVVVVTTSSKKRRLQEYLAAEDLPPLTQDEIKAIDEAGALGPPSNSIKAVVRKY